ncbi:MAG: hypothetical protein Kow00124_06980 [Anaerolineae bacterium]
MAAILLTLILLLTGCGSSVAQETTDYLLTVRAPEGSHLRADIAPLPPEEAQGLALPPDLLPIGSLYHVRVGRNGSGELVFTVPGSSAPIPLLDVYRRDETQDAWVFVPGALDAATGAISVPVVEGVIGLFEPLPTAPAAGALLEPGQQPAGIEEPLDPLLAAGWTVEAGGAVSTPPPGQIAAADDLLPVLRSPDRGVLHTVLSRGSQRQRLAENLIEELERQGLDGVVLDFGVLEQGTASHLTAFLEEMARALGTDRVLVVRVPMPTLTGDGWDTGGYDWAALGRSADRVILPVSETPGGYYSGGQADAVLSWAVRQVSRSRLYVEMSAASVDEWASHAAPLAFEKAAAPLGELVLKGPLSAGAPSAGVGQTLEFTLDSRAVNLRRDPNTGVDLYDVYAADGQHTIWLVTGETLRRQMDWVATYRIGGVILTGLFAEGSTPGALSALEEFRRGEASSLEPSLALHWQVRDGDGAPVYESTTGLADGLEWTPQLGGEYAVSAQLVGQHLLDLGTVRVNVLAAEQSSPLQEGVVVGGAPGLNAAPPAAAIPADMPAPVYPAGAIMTTDFELGGQVNHQIRSADYMRQAGMTWVKYQVAWHPGMDTTAVQAQIEEGHSQGFKVLISVVSQQKYPVGLNVADLLKTLEVIASYGPDAIEVWNEPNLDYEWPRGEISGANYVRWMLAPAYNVIKSVDPGIIVISAAPAPNGAFFGEGGCSAAGYGCDDWLFLQQMAQAGAANYMDCVGVHFNAGATSPTAGTGHPADPGYQHYSWYFGGMLQLYGGTFARQLCFTELGFLSPEGYGPPPPRFSWSADTSVAEQAQWLAEAAALSRESGRVRLLIVWNVDFTYWGDDPMAGYAIVRPGGGCPACEALGAVMP